MSNANSFELLFNQFSEVTQASLWVLDENPPTSLPAANPLIKVISNRYDVVELMLAKGFDAVFSDFCFEDLPPAKYQFIFFRISKEKALAHHVINSAYQHLADHGKLVFSGAKQEGIKGYIERASKLYHKRETFKADKQHWAAIFEKPVQISQLLDDKSYPILRPIIKANEIAGNFEFYSKPGVFGWDKIDAGSALLIDHLHTLSSDLYSPSNILDIGCGYGFLSVSSAKLFNANVVACDNNAAAIRACSYNLDQLDPKHRTVASNCTQAISEKFDLIVCNPPFHTGFEVENDLTEQFLKGSSERLSHNGTALFVVNLHIPLERKAKSYFDNIKTISNDNHFKVIQLDNLR